MTESSKFNIDNKAVDKIIELREQEPGDKEYALFLQIDGMQGNQYTYDLSFLDVEEARSDDELLKFGDLTVIIAAKDKDKFESVLSEVNKTFKKIKQTNK